MRTGIGELIELIEGHERAPFQTRAAEHVRGGGIVGYSVDPGPQRALSIKGAEAAPDGEANVLQQIAADIGIGFVGNGKAAKCRPKLSGGLPVLEIPIAVRVGHTQIVAQTETVSHGRRAIISFL